MRECVCVRGGGGVRAGGGGELNLAQHCHHRNDFCNKMGKDESHFNVSFVAKGISRRATRQFHKPQYSGEEKGEPKPYQPNDALLLDQLG